MTETQQLEYELLKAHANSLAEALADAAGYLASVRIDRKCHDTHGEFYAAQTMEWAEGALEYAKKANALLGIHDGIGLANDRNQPTPRL